MHAFISFHNHRLSNTRIMGCRYACADTSRIRTHIRNKTWYNNIRCLPTTLNFQTLTSRISTGTHKRQTETWFNSIRCFPSSPSTSPDLTATQKSLTCASNQPNQSPVFFSNFFFTHTIIPDACMLLRFHKINGNISTVWAAFCTSLLVKSLQIYR